MCPECICSWVLIDTFDWYPWSTSRRLNQYLVDTTLLTLDQHSTDSQPRVNRHMNQLKIWLTLNWDVDGVSIEHWWSRVSIETQPWMPLVRTIMIQNNWLLYCGRHCTKKQDTKYGLAEGWDNYILAVEESEPLKVDFHQCKYCFTWALKTDLLHMTFQARLCSKLSQRHRMTYCQ